MVSDQNNNPLLPMESPQLGMKIVKGCKVYWQGYNNWLWVADFPDDNERYARLVDSDGYTHFSRVPVVELWHVGTTHKDCQGVRVIDRETMHPQWQARRK